MELNGLGLALYNPCPSQLHCILLFHSSLYAVLSRASDKLFILPGIVPQWQSIFYKWARPSAARIYKLTDMHQSGVLLKPAWSQLPELCRGNVMYQK